MCGAVLLAGSVAASADEYKHPPVYVTCSVYGKLARCKAFNASDLEQTIFIYFTEPRYESNGNATDGYVDSGFIHIKNPECTPIIFYGTDPVNWGTYVVPVNFKLKDGKANFKDCPQENVAEQPGS